MNLKKLLKRLDSVVVKGPKDVEVTGVCSSSKIVAPGNIFVAKKGMTIDGAKYIPEAIEGGASVILTDIYDPTYKSVTQLIVDDVPAAEAILAAEYHGNPSNSMLMVGITGTNGKTTIAYLVRHILKAARGPCGLIGTIEYLIGDHSLPARHTTPEVTMNHKILHEMVIGGCSSAVMEVTSHALAQGRVKNIEFNIGVFSNLSPEHLDYHGTMENYCEAKNRLFKGLSKEGVCVANADDPFMERVVAGCQAPIITYGIDKEADLKASKLMLNGSGTSFEVDFKGKLYPCFVPLIGKYNVSNALAAIGVGIAAGIPMEKIVETVHTFNAVPGRLESVPNELGINIVVDFAHTSAALENTLLCLKEISHRKIITVFGCGGDRDKSKRPLMARVSQQLSDITVVTSDNPRSEDPKAIADEVVKGFGPEARYVVELDRHQAIALAISMAEEGDIVLVAGKGHEATQTFSHKTIEFDDRKVASEVCEELILQPQRS